MSTLRDQRFLESRRILCFVSYQFIGYPFQYISEGKICFYYEMISKLENKQISKGKR